MFVISKSQIIPSPPFCGWHCFYVVCLYVCVYVCVLNLVNNITQKFLIKLHRISTHSSYHGLQRTIRFWDIKLKVKVTSASNTKDHEKICLILNSEANLPNFIKLSQIISVADSKWQSECKVRGQGLSKLIWPYAVVCCLIPQMSRPKADSILSI